MAENKRSFDWLSLIIGILSLVVGYGVIKNPGASFIAVVYLVGIFAIVRGLYQLWWKNQIEELTGQKATALVWMGIINIIIGIIFLAKPDVGSVAISFLFALWFIMEGFMELFTSNFFRQISKGYYWLIIILAIINIIIGIALLFNPMLSAPTIVVLVSAYFFIFGIMQIIEAF